MRYYLFHIGDYAVHTRHLTPIQDLAYRRMLDLYYLHERPLNGCSADVARMVSLSEFSSDVETVLREFFEENDGSWSNKRADEEIAAFHSKSEAAAKAGKASGKARRNKRTDVQRTFNR